jgi:hypothetical protein
MILVLMCLPCLQQSSSRFECNRCVEQVELMANRRDMLGISLLTKVARASNPFPFPSLLLLCYAKFLNALVPLFLTFYHV